MSGKAMISEALIQNALYRELAAKCAHVFPNMSTITLYEADLIAITKSGYAYEYEIKLSLSDFRADLKKREKHASLANEVKKIPYPHSWGKEREVWVRADAPTNPYEALRCQCYPHLRPKEFWYVVHGFSVPEGELPPYAGLMRYTDDKWKRFEIMKPAPTLKAEKVSADRITIATRNIVYRYWTLRLKETLPGCL